jgi:hypothetical protein
VAEDKLQQAISEHFLVAAAKKAGLDFNVSWDAVRARGGRLLAAEAALLSIRPAWHLESFSCFRQRATARRSALLRGCDSKAAQLSVSAAAATPWAARQIPANPR